MTPERAAAQLAGEIKYVSSRPCGICGHSMRYTRNATCVECAKLHRNTERKRDKIELAARNRARAQGSRIYTSLQPCPVCQDTLRLTRDFRCVTCARGDSVPSPTGAASRA